MASINEKDPETDVVELCTILQCLGYNIRSMDSSGVNMSQDGGSRTVVINCQSSGLHVILERGIGQCSCPVSNLEGGSGFWQISAISGGRQYDKEFGSSLLGTLPKSFRDRLTTELHEIVRSIRYQKDYGTDIQLKLEKESENKSASMIEFQTTPDNRLSEKVDTPTRYRSLDALTNIKNDIDLPAPRPFHKLGIAMGYDDSDRKPCLRQGTYTLSRRTSNYTASSTSGSVRKRNKTSSPIEMSTKSNFLEKLINAEKNAESLLQQLSGLVNDMTDDVRDDSSISSLALDVSKISLVKAEPSTKSQFASSPNLSGLAPLNDNGISNKAKLNRFDSVSTSNLVVKKSTPGNDVQQKSRLRKLSPSFFKSNSKKQDSKSTTDSKGSKLTNMLKSKIATPVRSPKTDSNSNLSANKKKFSHIKSTIPKPTPKKE